MKNTLFITLLVLALLIPFVLKDGRRYRVMLMAIILLLPFYQSFIYFRYLTFAFAAIIIWLGDDKEMLAYTKEPINKAMIVFFVSGLLSPLILAEMAPNTFTALVDLMFFYVFFLTCLITIKRQLLSTYLPNLLLWGLLISVFVQTMQLLGIEAFYIYDENTLNTNTGMMYEESEDRILRYWGTFGNSLTFSSYLAVVGGFLFAYYHTSTHKRVRLLSFGILALALYGVALTAGRTALASILIGLFFYAFLKNWKKALILTSSLALFFFVASSFIEQTMSSANLSIYNRFMELGNDKSYRTEIWQRALPVFLENPLFGTGPGNLTIKIAPLIHKIFVIEKKTMILPWGHVESTYLSVLYTFGLIGFACFAYMLVKSFSYSLRAQKETMPPPIRQLGYALATGWVIMAVNMVSNPIFATDHRIIALMLLFVAMSIAVGWRARLVVKPQFEQLQKAQPVLV